MFRTCTNRDALAGYGRVWRDQSQLADRRSFFFSPGGAYGTVDDAIIFFALARTERLPQRVRTFAGAVVVLSAYGCWALVSGVASFLSLLAISAGGPWATACVVWFAGVASWNHYLFRPPRYHGSS